MNANEVLRPGLARYRHPDYGVATAGVISHEHNGKAVECTLREKIDGCISKAGCYMPSSVKRGDRPDAAGKVVIRELRVRHEPPL